MAHVGEERGLGTIGGLGLAPSGCYGTDYAYFEPVHGTAPDIAGQHIINPTATMLSAVMMLEYVGLQDAARRLERAIEETYAAGDCLTPDQGEVVLRAITARDTLEENLALLRAAKPSRA
jgi:isocitrate/isopropylmalate dehydrogenase